MKKEEESLNDINITVKLEEDIRTRKDAAKLAIEKIKASGCDPMEVKGFVYIVGPTVSDLLIVTPRINMSKKNNDPFIRSCTNDEWSSYFNTFIL